MHTFTAHTGGPQSVLSWTVDDSRTTTINPDTSFTTVGPLAPLRVDAGSYRLTFFVNGAGRSIPVCTEGGPSQNFHATGTPGAGTNVVFGCTAPTGYER